MSSTRLPSTCAAALLLAAAAFASNVPRTPRVDVDAGPARVRLLPTERGDLPVFGWADVRVAAGSGVETAWGWSRALEFVRVDAGARRGGVLALGGGRRYFWIDGPDGCVGEFVDAPPLPPAAAGAARTLDRPSGPFAAHPPDPAHVDVLFLVTCRALAEHGGSRGELALGVNGALGTANEPFGVAGAVLGSVAVVVVPFDFEGLGAAVVWERVADRADPFGAAARGLRDDYAADLVCVVVGTGAGRDSGCASRPRSAAELDAEHAFAVVRIDNLRGGDLTLAHELAHVFGCGHPSCEDGFEGARAYTWYGGDAANPADGKFQWGTLMAAPARRLPVLSNPGITYGGRSLGVPGTHDNAAIVRRNAKTISRYRCR